jgi:hypothetical protein
MRKRIAIERHLVTRAVVGIVALGAIALGMGGLAEAGGGGGISACSGTPCRDLPYVNIDIALGAGASGPLTSATFALRPTLFTIPDPDVLVPVVIDLNRSPRGVVLTGIDKAVLTVAPDLTSFTWTFTGFDPGDDFRFRFDADGTGLLLFFTDLPHNGIDLSLDGTPLSLTPRDVACTPGSGLPSDPDSFTNPAKCGPRVYGAGDATVTETITIARIFRGPTCLVSDDCFPSTPPVVCDPDCPGAPSSSAFSLIALGLAGLGAARWRFRRGRPARG